jgi:hypothetical protein
VKPLIAFASTLILLSACRVPNRVYNPVNKVPNFVPPPAPPASIVRVEPTRRPDGSIIRTDKVDPKCDPARYVCLAFIEFDEFGEPWDGDQLTAALRLIGAAKSGGKRPIVVTLTHGWENNADDRNGRQNSNITGFEGVLQFLSQQAKYKDFPIVGIFISWRGELISSYWPARRLLSYFNREDTAIRIPGPSMTTALTRIMLETHKDSPGAHLIMVGHSFGGLILERALSRATTDFVLRQTGQAACAPDSPCPNGAWPDLVVFVNSAAAATEGKQMLDFLKQHQSSYAAPGSSADKLNRTRERPLLLSISSLGDAATRFAVPIGHAIPFLEHRAQGSWRDYGAQASPPGVTSQSSYYLSTTAHMEALQSHLIVDTDPKKGELSKCEDAAHHHEYFGEPFTISTGQSYQICKKPGAYPLPSGFSSSWNTTPYWAMQMPATIVPDHSGIFNANFVTLLNTFLLDEDEMTNPGLRPVLTAK